MNKRNNYSAIMLITTSSFGKNDPTLLSKLEGAGLHVVVNLFGRTLTESEIKKMILEYQPIGIIAGMEPLTAEVLKQASCLRVISRCGVGMENIDMEVAKRLGIKVFNTPDAPAQAVAELTIALILNILRRVSEADRNIRDKKWEKLMGRLLGELTVGTVGCGTIGMKVASYLNVFGCNVIGTDPYIRDKVERITLVPLEDLLKESDIITFHVPLSKETINMVSDNLIKSMKIGTFIINTSRGEIIDEDALIRGLESRRIAGVAIDTFKEEPYEGPLTKFENVLLTAHMGSYAKEARIKMEAKSVENLLICLEELK